MNQTREAIFKTRSNKGFSFIELVVVIVALGVMVTMITPKLLSYGKQWM